MKTKIKQLFLDQSVKEVLVYAWVRTNRAQAQFGFLNVNDGSCLANLQVVYDSKLANFEEISKYRVGVSVLVKGNVILTPSAKQPLEIHATEIAMLGDCPENYPIQPKRHTREFLRENAHLRARTNLFNAAFSVRSVAAMAIHSYFQGQGYVYVHTPLITCADCEGSDQMFKISTLNFKELPLNEDGTIDYSKDLFGKQAFITGSGQLQGETFAMAFADIYTFGPTFRTENSNTKIHANEFWMIEPEIAFADLEDNMDLIEDMVKYCIDYVLANAPEEMNFFNTMIDKDCINRITKVRNSNFRRMTYTEAIERLEALIKKVEAYKNELKKLMEEK